MKQTQPTSMRLTPDALMLTKRLAQQMGITRTAVLETAIRDLAERKGIYVQQSYSTEHHRATGSAKKPVADGTTGD